MPTLNYDRERAMFSFTRPAGSAPFPGAAVSVGDGSGRTFSFEDVSPKNFYNIQLFKSFYGNEAKATRAAADRFAEIRETMETGWVERYRDLISGTPYKHQLETIDLMQKNDRYALLLEQGLGKTYIALQSFKLFKARDGYLRAVVVCPKVVYATWLHEIEKFAPEFKVLQYRGNLEECRARYEDCRDFEIMLTTYEMIRPRVERRPASWNGWAWQRLDLAAREALVYGMPGRLPKAGLLLADWRSMPKSARAKWRNACGEMLALAGDTYWLDRTFAYRSEKVFEEERVMMCQNVMDELRHDQPVYFIGGLEPNVLVFDEASRLVNPRAKQSEAAEAIKAKRKYLMSGTLCVGRPTDMYMPMRVLDRNILGMSWTAFRDKYCYVSRYNRNIITGYKNLDQLKAKVDPYMVAYRRDDCLDLPDRTVVTCYYEPDPAAVKVYDEVVTSDRVEVGGKTVNCQLQLQKIQKCMQLLSGFVNTSDSYRACVGCGEDDVFACAAHNIKPGSPRCARRGSIEADGAAGVLVEVAPGKRNAKLQMLKSDLEDVVDGEKVIVWYWYNYDRDCILGLLDSMKIDYVTAEDEDCAARFESNPDVRVFVGQIVQGIGMTLNSATTTIYYSHGLALEPRLQSMDRNMRIGQSKPVVVRDYVCRGSVEESVVSLLQHKEDVKDFMQKRVECLSCGSLDRCLENRVRRYGDGCIYHGDMKTAERKETLKLRTLGDCCED